jgi:O-antigen/teichoic acid export membrane protein
VGTPPGSRHPGLELPSTTAPVATAPRGLGGRFTRSTVARNTAWLTLGQGGRTVLQAAYFVVIARSLGPSGLGAFAAAAALSALAAPFAGLGAGNVLIQHVARDSRAFHRYWGGSLAVTLASGAGSVGLVILVSRAILPATIPTILVVCVAISDLLFTTVLFLCGQAYQSVERMARTAQLPIVTSFLRLVAAGIFVSLPGPHSPARWGVYYVTCTALSTLVAVALAVRELGRPALRFTYGRRELRDGLYFASGISAQNVYNDIDKTMLSRMSTLDATGIYSAAYRIIDVAMVPLRSLAVAAYPRFFRHGSRGVQASLGVARRLLPAAVGYGCLAGALLFLLAPLLPRFLGGDYAHAVQAVRWLALLPVLKSVQASAADTLTGAGYQGTRTSLQIGIALFNVGINIPLITHFSWLGAAWASLVTDGVLAALLWFVVWRFRHRAAAAT